MEKKTIAVLYGGCSSEYGISLNSGYAVLTNIDKDKYDIVPIGITKDGRWFRYDGDAENIKNDKWHEDKEHCIPEKRRHGFYPTRRSIPCPSR